MTDPGAHSVYVRTQPAQHDIVVTPVTVAPGVTVTWVDEQVYEVRVQGARELVVDGRVTDLEPFHYGPRKR